MEHRSRHYRFFFWYIFIYFENAARQYFKQHTENYKIYVRLYSDNNNDTKMCYKLSRIQVQGWIIYGRFVNVNEMNKFFFFWDF
jgi:hypothetical protein